LGEGGNLPLPASATMWPWNREIFCGWPRRRRRCSRRSRCLARATSFA